MATIRLSLLLVTVAMSAFSQPREERWLADIDFLVGELPRRHPNLFANTPRQEFERLASALRADVPALSDRAIQVRLAELLACLRDGHTAMPLSNLPLLPVVVRWFDDGLFVIGAPEDHPEWLGTRVVAVGGQPLDAALNVFKRVVSRDNEYGLRTSSVRVDFMRPDIWHALGVTPTPDALPLELESPAGRRMEANVEFGPPAKHFAVSSDGYYPLWFIDLGLNYWHTYLDATRTLYVSYNSCVEEEARPVAQWAEEVFALFDSRPVDRLVIDIRKNVGGKSLVFDPFLQQLSRRRSRFGNETKLITIIGNDTFSAAIEAERILRYDHGAITIGQAASGKPDSFGAFVTFTLPNSKLPVNVATKWIDLRGSGDAVEPERVVGFRARDFFTRHDPFLAAAMTYSPNPWATGLGAVRNAASLRAEPGAAPGSLVSIFGQFGSPIGPVVFSGVAARVIYASNRQINAVVPEEVPMGESMVSVSGEPLGVLRIVAANPGLFSMDAFDLRQPGAILNLDNTLNSAGHRARRTEVIQVFGTGFATGTPTVYIGHDSGRVLFSGGVEGVPGLWQLNVEVPAAPRVRGAMPLYVISGGVHSNAVTVFVE